MESSVLEIADQLASLGRYGDTKIMHISPKELELIERMYPGSITVNPETGQPEAWAWLASLLGSGGAGAGAGAAAGAGAGTAASSAGIMSKVGGLVGGLKGGGGGVPSNIDMSVWNAPISPTIRTQNPYDFLGIR